MPKIMIVDDEPTVRDVVRSYLERDQFEVIEAATGPQALNLLSAQKPDLVILDIMLPDVDGLSITQLLRSSGQIGSLDIEHDIPLILLTARTEETDRIRGFELGADDYVTKPFSPRELVMRVKALLRRRGKTDQVRSSTGKMEFPGLCIDIDSRTVQVNEVDVPLTPKEFDLLAFLAKHPSKVFTRPQLLDYVWGYESSGDDRIVTVHISRLREKLEEVSPEMTCIQTVWGVGYKFEL